jgi:hypothetical protein
LIQKTRVPKRTLKRIKKKNVGPSILGVKNKPVVKIAKNIMTQETTVI